MEALEANLRLFSSFGKFVGVSGNSSSELLESVDLGISGIDSLDR